jgi:hypothetical protein
MQKPLTLITMLVLGLLLLAPTKTLAEQIPGTTLPVEALPASLEWAFLVSKEATSQEAPGLVRDVWRFRSEEPYSVDQDGRTYLRFSLSVYQFEDEQGATRQFAEWQEKGQGFAGLTYAWVRIFWRQNTLYRLDIPCLFSKQNVGKLTMSLADALSVDDEESFRAIFCHCGMPCLDGQYSKKDGFQKAATPDPS